MGAQIIFVGGIHGVGKSTLGATIARETGLSLLSASKLIRWKKSEKEVEDIGKTQDKLILGLHLATVQGERYLLDGHYSLLNSCSEVQVIPLETFIQINPALLGVIINDPQKIKERLETRDGQFYDLDRIREFQEIELVHARNVSEALKIKLVIIEDNIYEFIQTINETIL